MLEIKDPLVARRNAILKGYAAFNDGDWDSLQELLCENVVWHTMEEPSRMISGRDDVLAYLQGLRDTTEAKFLGMAMQGDVAVTLDFTYTSLGEGDHACADEIVFDEAGCIKEVHHCAAATHRHGSAGQPTAT
jgi:hypothetical protein